MSLTLLSQAEKFESACDHAKAREAYVLAADGFLRNVAQAIALLFWLARSNADSFCRAEALLGSCVGMSE